MNKVVCDSCKKQFKVKIKNKYVGNYKGNVVKFNYFQCKRCKSKYFVSVDCSRVRQIHRELQESRLNQLQLKEKIKGKNIISYEIIDLQKKDRILMHEIKSITEQMKAEFKDWKE